MNEIGDAMTTVELNARKAEMIRMIMNDVNSEVVINELEQVIRRLSVTEPCRYTPEEIKTSAIEAIRQRKEGRYTSHEDMKHLLDDVSQ
jgi:aspartate/methionine/tyrosine aminotransferase